MRVPQRLARRHAQRGSTAALELDHPCLLTSREWSSHCNQRAEQALVRCGDGGACACRSGLRAGMRSAAAPQRSSLITHVC